MWFAWVVLFEGDDDNGGVDFPADDFLDRAPQITVIIERVIAAHMARRERESEGWMEELASRGSLLPMVGMVLGMKHGSFVLFESLSIVLFLWYVVGSGLRSFCRKGVEKGKGNGKWVSLPFCF